MHLYSLLEELYLYVLEVFSSIRKDTIQTISVPHPHKLKFIEQMMLSS